MPNAPRSDHSDRHDLTVGTAALNIFSATSFCRARGESETETAREVSVRGDKPFERPARRISRDVAIVRQNGSCGFLVESLFRYRVRSLWTRFRGGKRVRDFG